MESQRYMIRGGVPGRERLRLLSHAMRASTLALFERVGIQAGMRCLDCGCGGGDVSFELARLVASNGSVVGIDLDEVVVGIARAEARAQGLTNVEFLQGGMFDVELPAGCDIVYTRFLLTHLSQPERALERMYSALRPGGLLVVEDMDARGFFSHPESPAFSRHVDLYYQAARRRGGDPHIGARLPALLVQAGCQDVQLHIAQPAALAGDIKLLTPVTMEAIAEALATEGLVDEMELKELIAELYAFAQDPTTVMSGPRVVQAWGQRPQTFAAQR